jgi:NAD(P)-dependent dehydrogenase (short-subunit alcohol dehydrogenase family)
MSVVLITGCSSGFGMLAALEFARQGDTVYATMRNTTKAGRLWTGAEAARVSVEVLELDVTDSISIDAAIKEIVRREGRIDVLVNNAGIGTHGPIEDYDDQEVLAIFETNVFGVIRVTRAILPQMRSQGSGTIVTVGSLAGKVTAPFGGVYSASKQAVEALSDALYYELHPFGIRVVLIEPGGFETAIDLNSRPARRFTEGSAYLETERRFAAASEKLPGAGQRADAQVVADVIVEAAKAEQPKRRYLVGKDAELIAGLQKQMSDEQFEQAMRTTLDIWD